MKWASSLSAVDVKINQQYASFGWEICCMVDLADFKHQAKQSHHYSSKNLFSFPNRNPIANAACQWQQHYTEKNHKQAPRYMHLL